AKCSNKAADAAFKGKVFDETTCRSTATGKYDQAAAKLLTGDCPPCLDSAAQMALRDQLLTQLDAIDGQIFICPSSTTPTPPPTPPPRPPPRPPRPQTPPRPPPTRPPRPPPPPPRRPPPRRRRRQGPPRPRRRARRRPRREQPRPPWARRRRRRQPPRRPSRR